MQTQAITSAKTANVAATCPDCGQSHVDDLGPCRHPSNSQGLEQLERKLSDSFPDSRLHFCRTCHLGFRYPRLSEEDLKRLYASLPTQRWQYDSSGNTAWKLALATIKQRPVSGRGSILDIGAFDGAFLQSVPGHWDKAAIEPSDDARAGLVQQGVQLAGRFLQAPETRHSAKYDVVTMFDVFEHFLQPFQSLADAFAHVRPGGVLILSTGNAAHWTWRWLAGEHWYNTPMQHLCFGTPTYFQNAARKLSGQIIHLRRHAHQIESWTRRWSEFVASVAFAGRQHPGALRMARRLILATPGFKELRHRCHAPYAPGLSDHIYVVMEKPR